MPTYKGTFTNKSGTYLIEVFNDFDDFHIEIAQFKFSGNDLDGLALENLSELSSAEKLFDLEKIKVSYANGQEGNDYELRNFVLQLKIPQIIIDKVERKEQEIVMDFQLELKEDFEEAKVGVEINHQYFEGKNGLLELVFDQIQKQFEGKYRFKNCYGCLYGDYSVYGQGFMSSILCFKNQKEKYLKVQNKDEYFNLELHDSQQQEIYCCDEYKIRERAVGYRGTVK